MVLKGLIAATASIALMATPAAAAGSTSAATAQAAGSEITPASETADGMTAFGGQGNIVIILLAVVAIVLGIWAATSGGNDQPSSP